MKSSATFFLASSLLEKLRGWSLSKFGNSQLLIFFGSIAAVSFASAMVAVLLSKRRRHHHRHRHRHYPGPVMNHDPGEDRGRRKRRRRKQPLPTNPTRAETGGLPEPRDPHKPPAV